MTGVFEPGDPDFEDRLRRSYAKQDMMATIGAAMTRVAPGEVDITLPITRKVAQQHGFVHGGAVAMIADSACGFAALSLMPPGTGVLTAEFKVNFIAPATGERLVASGRVVKSGRTLTVAQAEVFAEVGGERKSVALMTATLATVRGREGVAD